MGNWRWNLDAFSIRFPTKAKTRPGRGNMNRVSELWNQIWRTIKLFFSLHSPATWKFQSKLWNRKRQWLLNLTSPSFAERETKGALSDHHRPNWMKFFLAACNARPHSASTTVDFCQTRGIATHTELTVEETPSKSWLCWWIRLEASGDAVPQVKPAISRFEDDHIQRPCTVLVLLIQKKTRIYVTK